MSAVRAAWCSVYGPPESVVVEELDDPVAGPGQAVVRIELAAVNFPDILIIANRYQISVPLPFSPGSEFAGVVEALGEGSDGVKVGDRVVGSCFVGAFAQRIAVAARSLRPVPDGIEMSTAAAYGVVYGTAYNTLRSVADVQPDEWVLVLGAAGGVGLAAVEIAHLLGARVLAAASSDSKLAACREAGADETINYETEDLKERAKELTGGGADVVVDPVGGRYSELAQRATRFGGRFVTVGYATGEIPRIPLNLILLKGVILRGFEIRTFMANAPELATRDSAELNELFRSGALRPHVSSTYPLAETAAALAEVADRRAVGKVLIDPWA
jgi:NADPH2:quinone reductase